MWWTIVSVLLLPSTSQGRTDCSKSEYNRCVRIADPLVKEAHLVFPDNMRDIDEVCKTWNQFVDCLKAYTDECFTAQQRRQFNRAVESPIESVHQMCMHPGYQREYLQHAPCIKNTIIQRIHCGPQYNLLVDQVDQGDIVSKSTLCCSHDRFKQCVIRETRRMCDRGSSDGPASRFASQIIDKALSFLQDQCYNYIPNSGDCAVTTSDSLLHSERQDPLLISPSPSEVYPWSTIQQEEPRERLPSRVTPPRITPSTWLPASNSPTFGNSPPGDFFSTSMLGSRSRPSSWGRSSSWESTAQVGVNTVQMHPEMPATQSSSPSTPRQDWAVTMSAWDVRGQPGIREGVNIGNVGNVGNFGHIGNSRPGSSSYPYSRPTSSGEHISETTTAWYPAAGNQLADEVEEPNQLGLQNFKNSASFVTAATSTLILLATILGIIV